MEKEMISVIIPTYNRAKTIKRAIDSVLKQTYSNTEIIVIDDCSTDNTLDIIKSYKNDKIRYYKLEQNSGACVARNKGIEIALGSYISFLDSDDEYLKEKLEKQMKILKETNTQVTFCALNFIENLKMKKIPNINIDKIKNMTNELLKENFIDTSTILAHKEVFKTIKFDKVLPRFQDWDIAIRISKLYRISYLDEALLNQYIQDDSITTNQQKKIKAYEILYNKYNKEINSDPDIKYYFNKNRLIALFNAGILCTQELKENLKIKFNLKILIYYIACVTKINKIILSIKFKKRRPL